MSRTLPEWAAAAGKNPRGEHQTAAIYQAVTVMNLEKSPESATFHTRNDIHRPIAGGSDQPRYHPKMVGATASPSH